MQINETPRPKPQITGVGEVVLDIGAPNGWGPVGMGQERMDLCLQRAKETAAKNGASVGLLRPVRQAEVQTVSGPGVSHITAEPAGAAAPGMERTL